MSLYRHRGYMILFRLYTYYIGVYIGIRFRVSLYSANKLLLREGIPKLVLQREWGSKYKDYFGG